MSPDGKQRVRIFVRLTYLILAGVLAFVIGTPTALAQGRRPGNDLAPPGALNNSERQAAEKIKLDALLTDLIETIDRTCELTSVQKQKLRLAGIGDIKRHVEGGAKRFERSGQSDRVRPLGTARLFSICPFYRNSILFKSVGNTLNGDQAEKWRRLETQIVRGYHEKQVKALVKMIDHVHPFQEGRADRLTVFLTKELEPCTCDDDAMSVYYLVIKSRQVLEGTGEKYLSRPQMDSLTSAWESLDRSGMERALRLGGYFPDEADRE